MQKGVGMGARNQGGVLRPSMADVGSRDPPAPGLEGPQKGRCYWSAERAGTRQWDLHSRTQEPRDTTASRAATRPEESLGIAPQLPFPAPRVPHMHCWSHQPSRGDFFFFCLFYGGGKWRSTAGGLPPSHCTVSTWPGQRPGTLTLALGAGCLCPETEDREGSPGWWEPGAHHQARWLP